jgi:adenine-specific DNA-methyltransferase
MAHKKDETAQSQVNDYRHAEKRKNIPPAGLAAQGKVKEAPKARYAYDPHLPPVLRFDSTGKEDGLPELLDTARQRPLTASEAQLLAEALRNRQPWLEWAGKREKAWFEVDPVALHIHERLSAQAILKLAQRQPLQRSLFADPELEYRQAVQFYQHDVDWANRLILGDSLTVMHSLARREDLAGKVQMIYIDPPYGIKFASNFQAEVGQRQVKDKESDLTREAEQVKAYRDTWTLGIHSYLDYLRDRLVIARELLLDEGSIFIQISDENIHRVRMVMDDVFGSENFCAQITFFKTTSQTSNLLAPTTDFLLWYAKNKIRTKYHQVYSPKTVETDKAGVYNWIEFDDGLRRRLTSGEKIDYETLPASSRIYRLDTMTSQSGGETTKFDVDLNGGIYHSGKGFWKTNLEGMQRLISTERVTPSGITLAYVRYIDDFAAYPFANLWTDTGTGSFTDEKIYVVQTGTKVIQRCMLMTTDPGDLVLDPTCGSGTTAYVAEQWGRRWITIDTSRVAIALARQRLLTAKYDYYELKEPTSGPSSGFHYQSVPHITLKSIAQNQALDAIFARWEPLLAEKLAALNAALPSVTAQARTRLLGKLAEKERREGKSALSEADRRRWLLPPPPAPPQPRAAGEGSEGWQAWEVPFDSDPDWPEALQSALKDYRQAWRGKMDEVNATIAASAPQEELVDKPRLLSGVVRVSGPFTVEGVQPIEETLELETPIGGEAEELETFSEDEPANAEAYLEKMIRLLRQDGVRFPDNKVVAFSRLEPVTSSLLHAEGEWGIGTPSPFQGEGRGEGKTAGEGQRRVAVSFGPQYGPITAKQVEECLREAYRRAYDDLVFAGFSIDGAAQAIIQEDPNPQVRCHLAHIRPDVNMGGLLKDTPSSQLFTVFGLPRVNLIQLKNGEWQVEMEGVDIYDPLTNAIQSTGASKVAAWFLDSDYDGQTFCVTQAFFPDASAWEKIARALKSTVDPERFAAFSGTKSLPFEAGGHGRVAVKVIDPRGNEVMRVMIVPMQLNTSRRPL